MIANGTDAKTTGTLDAKHRAELHASGIPDDMITRAGIRTVDSAEVRDVLGWQPKETDWKTGWIAPFRDIEGNTNGYAQIKLDWPRYRDGKLVKYESPVRKAFRAYFPPGFAMPKGSPLLITEGVKKALAAAARGFQCIAIAGVDGWQKARPKDDHGRKYGKRQLIPDLKKLSWKDAEVFIAYDSDAEENRGVLGAESRLAAALLEQGATVKVIRIPQVGDEKAGLDDFLVHHGERGADELRKLMGEAEEAETPETLGPSDWAREIVAEEFTGADGVNIRWHQHEFWIHRGTHYEPIDYRELTNRVHSWLDARHPRVTPRLAGDVTKSIEPLSLLSFDLDKPFWIRRPKGAPDAESIIPFKNGLFDIGTVGTDPVLWPHTPQFFCAASLPYDFNATAECPNFMRFLESSLEGDEGRIALLQKWFGLLLTTDTSLQKFLMLVGPPRCGKGTITKILEHVVGEDNCTSPTLSSLGSDFGLWPLLDKRVAIVQDAHLGRKADSARIVEVLKSIVGEDGQNVNRKNLPILRGVRLAVRFVVSANEMPALTDASGALVARLSVIPFNVSFVGREDPQLFNRIKPEASGVLNWALRGLHMLRTEDLHVPEASHEIVGNYQRLTSPILAFTQECCIVEPCDGEPTDRLFDTWCQWAIENGYKPGSKALFGERLRNVNRSIERQRRRTEAGGDRDRAYFYANIQLNEQGAELLERRRNSGKK